MRSLQLGSQHPIQPIKLVIFDCDGVLLDSEKIGNRVEMEALKTLNINIDNENYQKRFAGVTTKNAFETIAHEAGINLSPKFLATVEKKIIKTLEKEVKIIPYVFKALRQIKISKAVASNSHFARLSKFLRSKNLTHFFDGYIFSADMVKHPKPAPDLYQYVAKKMLVLPRECLVIEDSVVGIQAAYQAGMKALGFINSQYSTLENQEDLLKAGALQVFFDMRELPNIISKWSKLNDA
jgi:HAD superfamily hydrolase (TIGR01509 family)